MGLVGGGPVINEATPSSFLSNSNECVAGVYAFGQKAALCSVLTQVQIQKQPEQTLTDTQRYTDTHRWIYCPTLSSCSHEKNKVCARLFLVLANIFFRHSVTLENNE